MDNELLHILNRARSFISSHSSRLDACFHHRTREKLEKSYKDAISLASLVNFLVSTLFLDVSHAVYRLEN